MGDEPESQDGIRTLDIREHQNVALPVTVHSSLDAIAAICDEIRAMDLQKNPQKHPQNTVRLLSLRILIFGFLLQKRECLPLLPPQIEFLHHQHIAMTGCYICIYLNRCKNSVIILSVLDACANCKGNSSLCFRYCSPEDTFLSRGLQGEFVWINPPFIELVNFYRHTLHRNASVLIRLVLAFYSLLASVCRHPQTQMNDVTETLCSRDTFI